MLDDAYAAAPCRRRFLPFIAARSPPAAALVREYHTRDTTAGLAAQVTRTPSSYAITASSSLF